MEDYIKGVINLRGVVTPIIDLRSRLELPPAGVTERTRNIIVALGRLEAGFICDEASDVLTIAHDVIERFGNRNNGLQPVGKSIIIRGDRILNLLDSKAVLDRNQSANPPQGAGFQ